MDVDQLPLDLDELDLPDLDEPELDDGGVGEPPEVEPPRERPRGGGGRRRGMAFLEGHGLLVAMAAVLLLFGVQNLLVFAFSASGGEAAVWMIATTFGVSFLGIFWFGAKWIEGGRRR